MYRSIVSFIAWSLTELIVLYGSFYLALRLARTDHKLRFVADRISYVIISALALVGFICIALMTLDWRFDIGIVVLMTCIPLATIVRSLLRGEKQDTVLKNGSVAVFVAGVIISAIAIGYVFIV